MTRTLFDLGAQSHNSRNEEEGCHYGPMGQFCSHRGVNRDDVRYRTVYGTIYDEYFERQDADQPRIFPRLLSPCQGHTALAVSTMDVLSTLALLVLHPVEFAILLRFRLFHGPTRDLAAPHEHPTSGWDRKSMRRCWEFLDMTSRSFSVVIKELEGDLARAVRMRVVVVGVLLVSFFFCVS